MLHFVQISYQKVILQILLYNCIDQKIFKHIIYISHRKGLTAITKFHPCWQILTRLSGFISNIMTHIKPGLLSSSCSTVFYSHCSCLPQPLPIILQPILLWMNINQCVFCVVCFRTFWDQKCSIFIHYHPSSATGQKPMPQTIAAIQSQCDYKKEDKIISFLLQSSFMVLE